MQTHPLYGGPVLTTESDIKSYLQQTYLVDLPLHIIHFLEYPSNNNRYGDIFFHYDAKMHLVTCAPYFSDKRNNRPKVENTLKETDPVTILRLGSIALTNLTVTHFEQLGDTIVYNYSRVGSAEKIIKDKYLHAIDGFEGKLEENEAMLQSGPNGLPFWISPDLLPSIFEPVRNKQWNQDHHQYEAYKRILKWILQRAPLAVPNQSEEDLSKIEVDKW